MGVFILKRNGQKMGFLSLSDKGKREKSSTPPAEIWGKAGGSGGGLMQGRGGFSPDPRAAREGRGDCFPQWGGWGKGETCPSFGVQGHSPWGEGQQGGKGGNLVLGSALEGQRDSGEKDTLQVWQGVRGDLFFFCMDLVPL